jgi:hypothetical protein
MKTLLSTITYALLLGSFAPMTAGCSGAGEAALEQGEQSAALTDGVRLPKKLVCDWTEGTKTERNVLYTRLAPVKSRSQLGAKALVVWGVGSSNQEQPRRDEIADGWRGFYYSAAIDQSAYRYDLWTCDSEDRFYSFETEDLLLPAEHKGTSKPVTGKLRIEIRDLSSDHDLRCNAFY